MASRRRRAKRIDDLVDVADAEEERRAEAQVVRDGGSVVPSEVGRNRKVDRAPRP